MGTVTLREIAERAGVSTATVSRVLASNPRISAETSQHVLAVAEELGYSTTVEVFTSPARTANNLIGVVVADIASPLLVADISAAEAVASLRGSIVTITDCGQQSERERLAVQRLRDLPVAGLLVSPTLESVWHLLELRELGIPVVALGLICPYLDSVSVDHRAGGRLAAMHLLAAGHRRIGYVECGGPNGQARWEGLDDACREQGITLSSDWRLRVSASDEEGGGEAAQKLRTMRDRPTAIIAASDRLAAELVIQLNRLGLRVPEDVAIIGAEDSPLARLGRIPLTTTAAPAGEIGKAAIEMLFDRIDQRSNHRIEHVLLQPALVVRDSSSPSVD